MTNPITLRRYFEASFLPALTCTDKVKRSYVQALDKFIAFRAADPVLADVTEQHLDDFHRWCTATGRSARGSAKTYRKRMLHVIREANGWERKNGQDGETWTTPGAGTLAEFFAEVYRLEKALQVESERQIEMSIRVLDRWHGRQVLLSELSDELVNRWLLDQEGTRKPRTIHRRRGDILAVWRHAEFVGAVEGKPDRIRKVRVPRHIPEAFSMNELAALLAAAETFTEYLHNGLHVGRFWVAFINVAYDTGLRLSDLLSLDFSQIDEAGTVAVLQQKTQSGQVCRLRPETLAAVLATRPPDRTRVFDWPFSRETFYERWHAVLKRAGLPVDSRNGPQKIRRSSATYLEMVAPGMAGIHLGHSTHGLAAKHYIDPRIAYEARPLPPAIAAEGRGEA